MAGAYGVAPLLFKGIEKAEDGGGLNLSEGQRGRCNAGVLS
jgi:hypothetical protein